MRKVTGDVRELLVFYVKVIKNLEEYKIYFFLILDHLEVIRQITIHFHRINILHSLECLVAYISYSESGLLSGVTRLV